MEGIFIYLIVLAILGVSGTIASKVRKPPFLETDRQLRRVLPECGWKGSTRALKGKVSGLAVTLPVKEDKYGLSIDSVHITDETVTIPPDLSVTPGHKRSAKGQDLQTGDKTFDRSVWIQGKADEVAAIFGSKTRDLLAQFLSWGKLEIKRSKLSWKFDSELCQDAKRLAVRVKMMVELARMLKLPALDIPRWLAKNARNDPVPEVRLECFGRLLKSYSDSEHAGKTARSLIRSGQPRIRLLAARHLGAPAGIPVLRSLFHDPADDDEELPREAMVALAALLPRDEALSLLLEVIRPPKPLESLFLAAVRESERLGFKGAVPYLLPKVAEADGETLDTLARALGTLADASAEEVLLSKLDASQNAPSVDIVRALGKIGSAASVQLLLRVTRNRSSRRDLKAAAYEAIAQIQSRLAGAEAGQLSLSEMTDERGALSEAKEAGELTVVDPEAQLPSS